MTAPRTEAGRRLLAKVAALRSPDHRPRQHYIEAIAAIEAEAASDAVAAYVADLRAKVKALPLYRDIDLYRQLVLALLDPEGSQP